MWCSTRSLDTGVNFTVTLDEMRIVKFRWQPMQWDLQVWWWLVISFPWSLSKELWYLLPGISP